METFQQLSHKGVNTLSTRISCFIVRLGVFQYIVDNIMLTNYHTLTYVVSTLHPKIDGLIVKQMFSQERDQLVVTFHATDDALVISCQPEANIFYLQPKFARARTNSANLFGGCWEKKIQSVLMHPSDRVATLELGSNHALHIQFFGPASNVLLVDNSNHIVDAFKNAKALIGSEYTFRRSELIYDLTRLQANLREEPTAIAGSIIKKTFPTLGSTLVAEILYRADVTTGTPAKDVDASSLKRLLAAVSSVISELAAPSPIVYCRMDGSKEVPAVFSLISLRHCGDLKEKRFDDIHEAIRYFVFRRHASRTLEDQKTRLTGSLRQQLKKAQRSAAAIEEDLDQNERAADYEEIGRALMSSLGLMKKGMKKISLPLDGKTIDVRLDGKLTPVANAQRYFDKAKQSRLAARQGAIRLQTLRPSILRAEALMTELESVVTTEELKRFMAEQEGYLEEFGLGEKAKEREQLPFRIFTVDGGFEVWAGKSSANNDVLTMKHAKPNDLWFHARGSSGSHVVLKMGSGKGEVSKKAKEQAAGIAAYYSKMKKAKLVPVAMTEKKYVRKPKGSPPGTVTLEREKVIFAEPRLPEQL